jgi:HD-like signal output (HDOD) protein
MKRILFVDDEPRILTGLRRMLRGLRREWEMVFAGSGAEALDQCASSHFDVIVTDARMPGMEGSELLAEVRRRHPDTVRVILSGQCSRESVLRCVGVAHQFLSKPCDAETLKTTVRRVCALRDRFRDGEARQAVSRIQSLPSQPSVQAQLAESVESTAASVEDVADVIGRDVAMCAKIVQLVSSGFFGTPQRVTDAARAASLLGVDTIRGIVACGVFSGDVEGIGEERLRALNEHSLAVAAAAAKIAATGTDDRKVIDSARLAGMLHAVGELALPSKRGRCLPVSNVRAGRFTDEPGLGGDDAAGASAAPDPGGYLMALWGLPDPVVQAISCHGVPGVCPDQTFGPLTAVHVAHALVEPPAARRDAGAAPIDLDYLQRTGHAGRLNGWRELCADCRLEGAAS